MQSKGTFHQRHIIRLTRNMNISTTITHTGLKIKVDKNDYIIKYPDNLWSDLPSTVKEALAEHLTFTNTNYLSVLYDEPTITYNTHRPLLEPFLFKNQLYDMIFSEKVDGAKDLEYVKRCYNAKFEFKEGSGSFISSNELPSYSNNDPIAIVPFSFGKESLATLALCNELGIKPILMFVQEPTQGYEDAYKKIALKELEDKFGFIHHRIINQPALLRSGVARYGKVTSEVGWGTQTTDYIFYALPLILRYKAQMIFFGSEYSNNEFEYKKGWRLYPSFDQTTEWSQHQNNIARILTDGRTSVNTTFEPLEEIHIMYMLHHRYPELGKLQFSCFAEKPLYKNSQWCHNCYKCTRMFIFALACNIDPHSIGFKKNLMQEKNMFNHYFGDEIKTGSNTELDFVFTVLHKKNISSPYVDEFRKKKLKYVKPYSWYLEHFGSLQPYQCLPKKYEKKMINIFKSELKSFLSVLPH